MREPARPVGRHHFQNRFSRQSDGIRHKLLQCWDCSMQVQLASQGLL